jgi:hypothetical protein
VRPGEAILRLSKLGYHVMLAGEKIKVKFQGEIKPDPAQVTPLLEAIREDRQEAILFLRSYCPRCGGCFFWSSLGGNQKCMNCEPPDWQLFEKLYPQLQEVKH